MKVEKGRRWTKALLGILAMGLTVSARASVHGKVQSRDWPTELARIQAEARTKAEQVKKDIASRPSMEPPRGQMWNIRGTFSGREVLLSYSPEREEMSGVSGFMGPDEVKIAYMRDKRLIVGLLNRSSVDLEVKDNRTALTYTGNTRAIEGYDFARPANLEIRWVDGTVEGEFDGCKVSLFVTYPKGRGGAEYHLGGIAQMSAVDLSVVRTDEGLRVSGTMNRAPVDLLVRGINWAEFLRYLFIFLGETRALPKP
ncbi:MAG: hypothetical protein WC943_17120 [Elusimicrobiota bacterium]